MFSEYASRFLARSNLRDSRLPPSRRPRLGAGLGASTTAGAPLFFSAADYPQDDDDREHEQEVSAIYALQKSRRNLYYFSDDDENSSHNPSDTQNGGPSKRGSHERSRTSKLANNNRRHLISDSLDDGIRSSWNPGHSASGSELTETASGNPAHMVDVSLNDEPATESTAHTLPSSSPGIQDALSPHGASGDTLSETSKDPEDPVQPPIQRFRQKPGSPDRLKNDGQGGAANPYNHQSTDLPGIRYYDEEAGPQSDPATYHDPLASNMPSHPNEGSPFPTSITHDRIWTQVYGVCMAWMFATAFIVWLHTANPVKSPIGDSIYTALTNALPLLAIDTLVAVTIALVWMICLKFFIRPLLYVLIVSVPVVMLVLTIYPLVISLNVPGGHKSVQDRVMSITSFVPLVLACVWIFILYRGSAALQKATSILQLALTIFAENPALLACGFATLLSTILFTWVWIFLVIRVFLNGSSTLVNGVLVWQMDSKAWLMGAFFVWMYLWTLGVLSNLQRVATAATVSHWYFYRSSTQTFSPSATFSAAVQHALTTVFGSVCFSAFVGLLIRLPLLLLPSRIGRFIHMICFNLIASPVTALSDPLALTYASVHSSSLVPASRRINQLRLTRESIAGGESRSRTAYRLAKMLLTATRWMTSLALGFGAWISAVRTDHKGSLYGYAVGLLAGTIGWAVLGAAERSLANIVDACLVCAATDYSSGKYCPDAQKAFNGL